MRTLPDVSFPASAPARESTLPVLLKQLTETIVQSRELFTAKSGCLKKVIVEAKQVLAAKNDVEIPSGDCTQKIS